MKTKILDKSEDKVFKREKIRLEFEHPSMQTPDRKTVLQAAVKLLNTNMDNLIIRKVGTVYGEPKSIVTLHVYKNKKDLEANEPKYLIKRNTFAEEKKEEEKPAETPKTEEKKEESK
ncbi:MAG: 30S ribosomal protein S24e [Nanoarchaeota archaeon]|nr:30S ribosomal protein S24e [Nanoarchaeota archaeon]